MPGFIMCSLHAGVRFESSLCLKPLSAEGAFPAMVLCRKPLDRREIEIIQRMKKVLKYKTTKIAEAVGRNKSTVYRALKIRLNQTMPRRGRSKALDVWPLLRFPW